MQIDDLVRFVRIETPGIIDEIVVQAIAGAASEFCERTRVWDEWQDPVTLMDGEAVVDLEAPTDARALTAYNAMLGGTELAPVTMGDLVQFMPDWKTATGQPRYYSSASDWSAITLFPSPLSVTDQLMLRVQYAPKATSKTLPNFLAERFHDALIAGAKARVFAQMNVPWSNPAMADQHRQIFERAIENARIEQLHDRVPSTLRVKPVRFG